MKSKSLSFLFVRHRLEVHCWDVPRFVFATCRIVLTLSSLSGPCDKEEEVRYPPGKWMSHHGERVRFLQCPPSILFNVGMCRGMEYTMVSTIFVVPFSAPVIFLASVAEHADETCTAYFLMCMWVALLLLVIVILLFALPSILPIILRSLSFLHRHSILILLILLLPMEGSTTILKAILHIRSCTNRKVMIGGTMPPMHIFFLLRGGAGLLIIGCMYGNCILYT